MKPSKMSQLRLMPGKSLSLRNTNTSRFESTGKIPFEDICHPSATVKTHARRQFSSRLPIAASATLCENCIGTRVMPARIKRLTERGAGKKSNIWQICVFQIDKQRCEYYTHTALGRSADSDSGLTDYDNSRVPDDPILDPAAKYSLPVPIQRPSHRSPASCHPILPASKVSIHGFRKRKAYAMGPDRSDLQRRWGIRNKKAGPKKSNTLSGGHQKQNSSSNTTDGLGISTSFGPFTTIGYSSTRARMTWSLLTQGTDQLSHPASRVGVELECKEKGNCELQHVVSLARLSVAVWKNYVGF